MNSALLPFIDLESYSLPSSFLCFSYEVAFLHSISRLALRPLSDHLARVYYWFGTLPCVFRFAESTLGGFTFAICPRQIRLPHFLAFSRSDIPDDGFNPALGFSLSAFAADPSATVWHGSVFRIWLRCYDAFPLLYYLWFSRPRHRFYNLSTASGFITSRMILSTFTSTAFPHNRQGSASCSHLGGHESLNRPPLIRSS